MPCPRRVRNRPRRPARDLLPRPEAAERRLLMAAGLKVAQLASADPAAVGDTLTLVVIVSLDPTANFARDVVLEDRLPAGVEVGAIYPSAGMLERTADGFRLTIGTHAGLPSVNVTILLRPSEPGPITNVATVRGEVPDVGTSEDTSSLTVDVVASRHARRADLAVQFTQAPRAWGLRTSAPYVVRVTNRGPLPATGVILNVNTAGGVIGSGGPSQGFFLGDPFTTTDRMTLYLGTIAPGASATFDFGASTRGPGPLSLQALARGDQIDPRVGNNAATASTIFTEAPHVRGVQRFGVHRQPSWLLVDFDAPLNVARAQDPRNYRLIDSGRDGRLGTADDRAVPIRGAAYGPGDDTGQFQVTLVPRGPISLWRPYRLRIRANPANGLSGASGVPLDGDRDGTPGGDAVLLLDARRLAGPAVATTLPPQRRSPGG